VHERAAEEKQEGKRPEHMRAMFCRQQKTADEHGDGEHEACR
jgi:hypothetical protein